jgi:hypothetical protein
MIDIEVLMSDNTMPPMVLAIATPRLAKEMMKEGGPEGAGSSPGDHVILSHWLFFLGIHTQMFLGSFGLMRNSLAFWFLCVSIHLVCRDGHTNLLLWTNCHLLSEIQPVLLSLIMGAQCVNMFSHAGWM